MVEKPGKCVLRTNTFNKLNDARTATDQQQNENGVRYSELLRLPYFDIVEYHVIDPMHNLLLGTGKYLMTMWKDSGILTKAPVFSKK